MLSFEHFEKLKVQFCWHLVNNQIFPNYTKYTTYVNYRNFTLLFRKLFVSCSGCEIYTVVNMFLSMFYKYQYLCIHSGSLLLHCRYQISYNLSFSVSSFGCFKYLYQISYNLTCFSLVRCIMVVLGRQLLV